MLLHTASVIMTKTKGNKFTKSDKMDNKKQQKASSAAKNGEVDKKSCTAVENENCHCVDCGKVVLSVQAGLTCDACGFWHHADCEDISDEVYEFLCDHTDDTTIAWYCKKCAAVNKKVITMMTSMYDQQQQIEIRVEQFKAEVCKKMEEMSNEMKELRGIMNVELDKTETKDSIVAVEEKVTMLVETVEKQRAASHDLRDCVQDAVREKLQEDKEELDDIKRRSTNVIIHGLTEAVDTDKDVRQQHDKDEFQEILHHINCDDVSVQDIVRLGKIDSSSAVVRPIKVMLTSEQARDRVLAQAKNLYGKTKFKKVFIQQDLTVKQREKRRELVQQLKQRKQNGETNLIIVQDRIVVRRPKSHSETEA